MPHLLPLISKLESCNDRIVGQQKKPRMFFCLIKAISIWEKFGLRPFLWFETWAEADFQFTTLISSICHACFSSEESAVYSVLGVSTALSQYSSTAPYTISLGDTGSPAAKEDTYTERNSLSPFRCWRRYTQSTGYSTKLDHRAFQSYTHSFFFSSFSTPEFYIFPASFASVNYLLAYFCRCPAKLGKGRDSSEWGVCERAKVLCWGIQTYRSPTHILVSRYHTSLAPLIAVHLLIVSSLL